MEFIDHFSENADLYAHARPTYPDALFAFIAGEAPARERAWDCATGNGQAALGLSHHFAHVEATDASAEQVGKALVAPGVRYSVQLAEKTDFADASFDAVCVAQALHWFDPERFYAEARRVILGRISRRGVSLRADRGTRIRHRKGVDAGATHRLCGNVVRDTPLPRGVARFPGARAYRDGARVGQGRTARRVPSAQPSLRPEFSLTCSHHVIS